MAKGFNPFKKLFGAVKPGGGGLLGMRKGPQSISPVAAKDMRNPAYTVSHQKMMSQPYPDRLLKIQASKNLGYDPNWTPDPYVEDRINMLNRQKNERLSPTGNMAADAAKGLAGAPAEFEYVTKELDQDFVSEALASALGGGAPELPGSGPRPPSGSQPQPGDYATLIPKPSPDWKRKKLEEIGLLA